MAYVQKNNPLPVTSCGRRRTFMQGGDPGDDRTKDNPFKKQKLSAEAAKNKAERDLKAAKTPIRRKKKAENQKLHRNNPEMNGLDYDHKDGKFKSVKANRGNDGKGTKSEG